MALDRQRGDRRRTAREVQQEPPQTSEVTAVDALVASERAAQLWKGIDALPEKLRIVLVLAGIEEHNVEEVARLLKVPVGTVKSRLFAARHRLKEQLQWTRTDVNR